MVTGPAELATPVNHVLPAWDVACGIYAALAVITALRHRDATGQGQQISIPLENVALATAGNLSLFTEVMVNGTSARTDRQLGLRPVRPGLHQQRRGVVHDRRAHRPRTSAT